MSLVITQTPSTEVGNEISTWNAVGNPVIFKMQRKDFNFDQINNNGGFTQFQFNGFDYTGSFANGDSLYVNSSDDIDDFCLQTAVAFSGGNTLITTDIPYSVAFSFAGFINNLTLKPSYRVEVSVFNAADDEMLSDAAFSYSPTSRGALTIDITSVLRSHLLPDNDADLTGTTEVFDDTNAYIEFYIEYQEVYTGYTPVDYEGDKIFVLATGSNFGSGTSWTIDSEPNAPGISVSGNSKYLTYDYIGQANKIYTISAEVKCGAADDQLQYTLYMINEDATYFIGGTSVVVAGTGGVVITSELTPTQDINRVAVIAFESGGTEPHEAKLVSLNVSVELETYFAVIGSRQIPSPYGGNMGKYVSNGFDNFGFTDVLTPWQNSHLIAIFNSYIWALDGSGHVARTDLGSGSNPLGMRYFYQNGVFKKDEYNFNININNKTNVADGALVGITIVGSNGGSTWETVSNNNGGFVTDVEFGNTGTYQDLNFRISSFKEFNYFGIYAYRSGDGLTEDIDLDINYITIGFKFLTKLERPVMWRGYPFLISAIINENIANDIFLKYGTQSFASGTDTTPADYSGKIAQFDLNQIITDQTIDETDIAIWTDVGPKMSETLTIELRDPCANPILLVGRNSLGGPLEWMFDKSQEYTFDYGNQRKAKRLVLTANNLTINEWEALQDFITLGEVYRNNIVEFTGDTIQTSSRIGQQLYVVDEYGNKIGVVAIPTKNRTITKQIKHTFEIEIEYPETFSA